MLSLYAVLTGYIPRAATVTVPLLILPQLGNCCLYIYLFWSTEARCTLSKTMEEVIIFGFRVLILPEYIGYVTYYYIVTQICLY